MGQELQHLKGHQQLKSRVQTKTI